MTTSADPDSPQTPDSTERAQRLRNNLARIEELSARLTAALARRKPHDPALNGPSADVYMKAASAYLAGMIQNPARVIEQQVSYWGKTLEHYAEAQRALATGEAPEPGDGTSRDRRFANPLWHTHPYFNLLRRQYQLNADTIGAALDDMTALSDEDRKRVEYFTRQIVDMLSPTNFLGTNPEALERAVETDGESLVRGLENLVRDIEANDGELIVTLADPKAFSVGENLATTPGSVVFRNRLFELIHYRPATEKVRRVPLLIFPPWINKYYILDLKPQNSLVRWLVDQGYSLFMVSWVNPDASYADTSLDDYIGDGFLRAIAEVQTITGEKQINAVGYCIAGTTLALTLAYLKRQGDRSVRSATFLTTLTDFSEPGEMGVFLTDDFVDGIGRQVEVDGILSHLFMQRTFSFLRSNDLVYGPAIRRYMLGETPPAFDLLFWNGDSTNLPGRMAMDYLRGLCQRNGFASGQFAVLGEPVSLHEVTVPLCAIACESDHIAPWKSSFQGVARMGSRDKTFLLSGSGHIAGIVNPPTRERYGYRSSSNAPVAGKPEDWLAATVQNAGSWWPRWGEWLGRRSGAMVSARLPGDTAGYPALCDAPGTYVIGKPYESGEDGSARASG